MQIQEVQIQSAVIDILKDMTQEWDLDLDAIGPQTQLVSDLNFASIDFLHLAVSVEEHFKRKLVFQELLMQNGQYIDDVSIEELVSFVSKKLRG